MLALLRELLIEGKASGELFAIDVEVSLDAVTGALSHVALMQLMRHGTLDADDIADKLVPVTPADSALTEWTLSRIAVTRSRVPEELPPKPRCHA